MIKLAVSKRESRLSMAIVVVVGMALVVGIRRFAEPPRLKTVTSADNPNAAASRCGQHADRISGARPEDGEPLEEHPREAMCAADTQADQHEFTEPSDVETPEPEATDSGSPAWNENDPAVLCAALCKANADGRGADLSAIRASLFALGRSAVPAVVELLRCGTESVEIEAVRLLVQMGDPQGLAAALGKLLTVPRNSGSYGLFLLAFADNHSEAVASWLTDMLGTAQFDETRGRMLDLLLVIRGPEAVAALEHSALAPADEMHARDCIDLIANRHDASETGSLAAMLESQDAAIREAAAYGLANVGSSEACLILARHAETDPVSAGALAMVSSSYAQETLLSVAIDQNWPTTVRAAAIQSLSGQSGYRVGAAIANASVHEQDQTVAEAMLAALETMDSNQADVSDVTQVAGSDNIEEAY